MLSIQTLIQSQIDLRFHCFHTWNFVSPKKWEACKRILTFAFMGDIKFCGCHSDIVPYFQLYPDQVQMLLDAFKNPPQTREEGLYFEDKQYKCVRADKSSIYAKHVSHKPKEKQATDRVVSRALYRLF